jgi:hypothetical protein
MNVPESHTPEKMNWVDYCDALRGRQFFPRAQAQKPLRFAEHFPDPAVVTSAQKEMMRDLT